MNSGSSDRSSSAEKGKKSPNLVIESRKKRLSRSSDPRGELSSSPPKEAFMSSSVGENAKHSFGNATKAHFSSSEKDDRATTGNKPLKEVKRRKTDTRDSTFRVRCSSHHIPIYYSNKDIIFIMFRDLLIGRRLCEGITEKAPCPLRRRCLTTPPFPTLPRKLLPPLNLKKERAREIFRGRDLSLSPL